MPSGPKRKKYAGKALTLFFAFIFRYIVKISGRKRFNNNAVTSEYLSKKLPTAIIFRKVFFFISYRRLHLYELIILMDEMWPHDIFQRASRRLLTGSYYIPRQFA